MDAYFSLSLVVPVGLHHDTQFHRESNPMAGSFTAYHTTNPTANSAASLIAIQPIAKGEELFMDRTSSSSSSFVPSAYYEGLPSINDYAMVDELVQSLEEEQQQEQLTEAQFQDLLHRVATELIPAAGYDTVKTAILQALVPRSVREFQACRQQGSAKYRFLPPKTISQLEQEGTSWRRVSVRPK